MDFFPLTRLSRINAYAVFFRQRPGNLYEMASIEYFILESVIGGVFISFLVYG